MEQEADTTGKYARLFRLVHLFKKIFLWSFALFALNFILKKAGWETWDNFNASAENFSATMLNKMNALSFVTLYHELTTERVMYVKDSAKINQPERVETNPLVRALMKQATSAESKYKNFNEYSVMKMSFTDKLKRWCQGFWYTYDANSKLKDPPVTANWFGRAILLLAFVGAIWKAATLVDGAQLTLPMLLTSLGVMLVNMVIMLIYLNILSFIFYGVISLFLYIGDGLAGIFSYLMGIGGLAKFFIEELKSEAVDHTKQSFPLLLFSLFAKKK